MIIENMVHFLNNQIQKTNDQIQLHQMSMKKTQCLNTLKITQSHILMLNKSKTKHHILMFSNKMTQNHLMVLSNNMWIG